jgi:AcrR family transcriptional regulator
MAEISRRAGVGMATLYRNFPGRRELLEALYTDEVDAICEAAEPIDDKTPGTALLDWLSSVSAFFTSKHEVGTELLKHSEGSNSFFSEGRNRVLAAGQPLLAAAQRTREIRGDLTLEQILEMIHAIAAIQGDPAYVQPILHAALDGLRPPNAAKTA